MMTDVAVTLRQTGQRGLLLGLAVVIALTALVYASSLRNGFVDFDDGNLIFRNPAVQELSPRTLRYVFTSYDPELYIPLTFVSYQVEHALFGANPAVVHFTNLLLHLGNILLVALIIFRFTGRRWLAVLCAAAFALHPINAEAVLWASARKDLLSTFFFLGSIAFYLSYRDHGGTLRYWGSVFLFLLSLLAKVSVAPLPLILLLVDWAEGDRMRSQWKDKIPFFLLSLLFVAVAIVGKMRVLQSSGAWTNAILGAKSTAFYLRQIFFPLDFSALYPQAPLATLSFISFLPAIAVVTVLVASVPFLARRERFLAWCVLFFLLMLLPSFTNFQRHGFLFFASDRYAYVPSIGVFLFSGFLVEKIVRRWPRGRLPVLGGVLFCLCFCAVQTFRQTAVWYSTETLFNQVLRLYPESAFAHNNLGTALEAKKDTEGALREYERAVALDSSFILPRYNIANITLRRGGDEQVEKLFKDAITTVYGKKYRISDDLIVFSAFSRFLEAKGENDAALRVLELAAKLMPLEPEARYNLGMKYHERGRLSEALRELEAAERIQPRHALLQYHLAAIYAGQGRLPEAKKALEMALRLDPSNEDARKHLANIRSLMGE